MLVNQALDKILYLDLTTLHNGFYLSKLRRSATTTGKLQATIQDHSKNIILKTTILVEIRIITYQNRKKNRYQYYYENSTHI